MKHVFTLGVAICCWSSVLTAQTRIPVLIDATIADRDSVGRQVVFELKEAIRSSSAFRLIDNPIYRSPRSAADSVPFIALKMITAPQSGKHTVLAIAYVYNSLSTPIEGAFINIEALT